MPALEMGTADTTPDMRAASNANEESSGLMPLLLRVLRGGTPGFVAVTGSEENSRRVGAMALTHNVSGWIFPNIAPA